VTDWAAFAGFVGVVLVGLLVLSHRSARAVVDASPAADASGDTGAPDGSDCGDAAAPPGRGDGTASAPDPAPADRRGVGALPPGALLFNVALSQGAFALLLLFGVWYAEVPSAALGVAAPTAGALAGGVALGVALYLANEAGAAASDRLGLGRSEAVRGALAPASPAGWVALFAVVLPLVAGFEELLFRGVLVGALSTGFGISPWLLAACSSVAFALGHGAQGATGVVVTGLLGFALAAAFVLTGSLLVVFLAHYLVNALEFVVHEGLGLEPFGP
jgi:membrane protease YdiL (CAAX protease family)